MNNDENRFEQLKKFNTFIDKNSINHGKFGAEILFNTKDGIIRKFVSDDKYDKIIINFCLQNFRGYIKIYFTSKF